MKFSPGQSGNPSGRPRGARHKATLAAEALLDGEAAKLTRKAVDMALAGDSVALRLCLDRILPARRGRMIRIRLPRVGAPADLAEAVASVVAECAAGRITTEEAVAVGELLALQGKVLELTDLAQRVEALERRHGSA